MVLFVYVTAYSMNEKATFLKYLSWEWVEVSNLANYVPYILYTPNLETCHF
jgi:hypothetical protein